MTVADERTAPRRPLPPGAVVAIKAIHSVWFLSVAAALAHLLDVGVRGRQSRLTAPAYLLAGAQSAVFMWTRGRCPLTDVVARETGENTRVSDVFLPIWLADRVPQLVAAPLVVNAIGLAARRQRRGSTSRRGLGGLWPATIVSRVFTGH